MTTLSGLTDYMIVIWSVDDKIMFYLPVQLFYFPPLVYMQ